MHVGGHNNSTYSVYSWHLAHLKFTGRLTVKMKRQPNDTSGLSTWTTYSMWSVVWLPWSTMNNKQMPPLRSDVVHHSPTSLIITETYFSIIGFTFCFKVMLCMLICIIWPTINQHACAHTHVHTHMHTVHTCTAQETGESGDEMRLSVVWEEMRLSVICLPTYSRLLVCALLLAVVRYSINSLLFGTYNWITFKCMADIVGGGL